MAWLLGRDSSRAPAASASEDDAAEPLADSEAVGAVPHARTPKTAVRKPASVAEAEPAEEEEEIPIAQLPAKQPEPKVNVEVNVHSMRQRWQHSEPDPKWQAEVGTFLDSEIQRLTLDVQGKDISCRGPLCRIVLKFNDSAAAQKLYGVRQSEGVQSVADTQSDRTGAIEVTIFSTRPGLSLEDVAGGKG